MVHEKWLKSLRLPTPEQTARFADHVADNHSWYKHLPFFPPGASFVFFPNFCAGRGVKAQSERFVVCDIERGDYFAHHSRLPTADYLAQFGHWDYWIDDNPRAPDRQSGPWLYSADGSRQELLADDLRRQWSCRLTAFLKPAPPMFTLRAGDLEREAQAFLAYARAHPGAPDVTRYLPVVGELRGAADTRCDLARFPFMEAEMREQRKVLLSALNRVREAWAEMQDGPAEPSAAPNPAGM
jgi:hypothetical protein